MSHLKKTSDVPLLKQEVNHYRAVMRNNFNVPEDAFFSSIPVSIQGIKDLIANSGTDLAGIRIYVSKKSSDHNKGDHQIIIVPCREKKDATGAPYYEDMVGSTAPAAPTATSTFALTVECRKPPGCTQGALL